MIVKIPFKTRECKNTTADWILSQFPKNYTEMSYCEPFCGSASVFVIKEPSEDEVINDKNTSIISFFKALRDEPTEFFKKIKKVKCTEKAFNNAKNICDDYIDQAVNEVILRKMSRNGLKEKFIAPKISWDSVIKQFTVLSSRLENTIILNENAIDVIKSWDNKECVMFLDPPSLQSTRENDEVYEDDMTIDDHIELLNCIKNCKSKVLLNGANSSLYKNYLKNYKFSKGLWRNF